jgi:membrane protein implicated in regulation of membrane protease activity
MDSVELWRWLWLAMAVIGVAGEIATAGTFFILPFGVGAAVAAILAFAGVDLALQWVAFVAVSAAGVAATRPIARRLDRGGDDSGIGARRWIGQSATVLTAIPPGDDETGLVRIGREEWRAQSSEGVPIPAGSRVLVVEVTGTRLVVLPLELNQPRIEGDQP